MIHQMYVDFLCYTKRVNLYDTLNVCRLYMMHQMCNCILCVQQNDALNIIDVKTLLRYSKYESIEFQSQRILKIAQNNIQSPVESRHQSRGFQVQ